MNTYKIRYRVTEVSTFESTSWGDTQEQALATWREQAEATGYGEAGVWKDTHQVDVDPDSIEITETGPDT